MVNDWKKGDLLILERKSPNYNIEYAKHHNIGDRFILNNDWNTYKNMLFLIDKNGRPFSVRKKDLEYSFINLRIKRENIIDNVLN